MPAPSIPGCRQGTRTALASSHRRPADLYPGDGMAKLSRRFVACKADLAPGERRIVQVDGKSIGIFNVNGTYYALHNRCPHMAGPLCEGPVTGTARQTDRMEFVYERAGEILRCGWHGWEFDIASGRALVGDRIRARTYPVTVEDGDVIVHIG